MSNVKLSNPKDAIGIRKAPMSTVPSAVVMEIGLGLLEGAGKYGRHNYRAIGVRASVYYDATMRHLMAWWEGEDIDPASGLSHITKALSSLAVLRDAMLNDKVTDDRPPRMEPGWVEGLNEKAGEIIDRFPDPPAEPYTVEDDGRPMTSREQALRLLQVAPIHGRLESARAFADMTRDESAAEQEMPACSCTPTAAGPYIQDPYCPAHGWERLKGV